MVSVEELMYCIKENNTVSKCRNSRGNLKNFETGKNLL